MKKRVLSLLMAFVMVISLLPATTRAAETNEATVTVDFTAQAGGAFLCAPQFGVEVSSREAENFGYTDSVTDGVSALDVLVKAHEIIYGANFQNSPNTYLVVPNTGFITTIFEEKTGNCGFTVNGATPHNDILVDNRYSPGGKNYTGYTVTQAEVEDDDSLEFFIYQDSYALDNYLQLEKNGKVVSELTGKPESTVSLTVKGYCIAYNGCVPMETLVSLNCVSKLEDVQLAWVDTNANKRTDIKDAVTDEDGKVTLTLPKDEGTYYLTAYVTAEDIEDNYATPLIMSLIKVTVDANAVEPDVPQADPCALTALSVTDLNSNPNALELTPTFSPDVYTYTAAQAAYQSAEFQCMVYVKATAADEAAEIQAEVNGVSASLTSGNPNWTILNKALKPGQDNILTVTVTNGDDSKVYTVTIPMAADPDAPIITVQPQGGQTEKGSSFTLSITASSDERTAYQWEKYNTAEQKWMNIDGATSSTYEVPTAETGSARYRCTVSVTIGNTKHSTVSDIVTVTVAAPLEERLARVNALLTTIAAANTQSSSEWWVMDMAAYAKLNPAGARTTDAAKQAYINAAVEAVESPPSNSIVQTYAKAEIILRSIGRNCAQLYPVNSNTPLNVPTLLKAQDITGLYDAPWALLADLQGDLGLTDIQRQSLIGILTAAQGENGLLGYESGGVDYSPDTTATAIAALAPLYSTDVGAKSFIDKALTGLSDGQSGDTGSLGNANTDAMVIIGLAAMGINPATDAHFVKNGYSLLDGLLCYALADHSGFGYTNNNQSNAMATEQAFRALIAAAQVMRTDEAYNIYDFSDNDVAPARATGSGSTESPAEPTGTEITVRMTIKADSGYWFNGSVTILGEGATVYHALIKALEEAGMSQVGAKSGYVRSISKDGKTLSEFDNGENSGWLYKVNGDLPDVGLTSYAIKDGDRIVWYYTDDWTLDPDAGKWYVKPVSSTITPVAAIKDGIASASVSYKDLSEAISAAKKSGEDTVTITPEIKGKVNGIAVSLPKSAAANAAKQGVQLIVETDKARVSLRAEVLGELAKNSGSELKLEITEKRAEEVSDKLAHENLDGASIVEVTLMIDGKPVTAFGGKKLLIDIPVDSKRFRAGDTCRVLVLSDDGAAERTSGQCIKKNDALFVRVETTHLSTFVVMRDVALPFTDVADTAWYADAVQYVYENGLMTGVSESEFAPDGTATRGQIVTILWRLAGSPVVNYAMRYADVDEGAWYGEAVRWAASTGVVTGYSESSFGPNDAITREQLAAILYRYVKTQGQGFTGMWYFPLRYDDAASISDWADEAMHWCVMKGLLNGTGETTLSPQLTATRAQLATILQRFCELPKDTASKSAAQTAYDRASTYLTAAVSAPRYGSLGGEWTVLALARGGADTETAYFTDYYAALEQTVREANGVLSERKYTEYSRVILALSALRKDARDVAGFDLTLPLGDYEKTAAQGVNGVIYALLALDSRDYPMPQNAAANTQATRQLYVDAILAAQLTDGGWSFMGEDADPDLTAMALQALAKYREQSSVQLAANRALVCLSAMQNADGGFSSWGSENAESCAQVLLALNALDLDADDSRFVKNGHSVLDALLTYQNADGGFCHERSGETNLMASEQAACALASLVRAERGESGFYRMAALMQPAA